MASRRDSSKAPGEAELVLVGRALALEAHGSGHRTVHEIAEAAVLVGAVRVDLDAQLLGHLGIDPADRVAGDAANRWSDQAKPGARHAYLIENGPPEAAAKIIEDLMLHQPKR